jgi:hypothetical protein
MPEDVQGLLEWIDDRIATSANPGAQVVLAKIRQELEEATALRERIDRLERALHPLRTEWQRAEGPGQQEVWIIDANRARRALVPVGDNG